MYITLQSTFLTSWVFSHGWGLEIAETWLTRCHLLPTLQPSIPRNWVNSTVQALVGGVGDRCKQWDWEGAHCGAPQGGSQVVSWPAASSVMMVKRLKGFGALQTFYTNLSHQQRYSGHKCNFRPLDQEHNFWPRKHKTFKWVERRMQGGDGCSQRRSFGSTQGGAYNCWRWKQSQGMNLFEVYPEEKKHHWSRLSPLTCLLWIVLRGKLRRSYRCWKSTYHLLFSPCRCLASWMSWSTVGGFQSEVVQLKQCWRFTREWWTPTTLVFLDQCGKYYCQFRDDGTYKAPGASS